MHRIEITKKAHKQLAKLPKAEARDIYAALESLAAWPDCRNVKSLTQRGEYRLRIGDYRAIFVARETTITVTEVKRRNERTY